MTLSCYCLAHGWSLMQVAAVTPQSLCMLDSNGSEEDICALKDLTSSSARPVCQNETCARYCHVHGQPLMQVPAITPQGVCVLDSNGSEEDIFVLSTRISQPACLCETRARYCLLCCSLTQVAAVTPQGVCMLDSNGPEEDICVLKDFSSSPTQPVCPIAEAAAAVATSGGYSQVSCLQKWADTCSL